MIIRVNSKMRLIDNLHIRILAKIKTFKKYRNIDIKKIPIIINNYNRLSYLQKQIAWLESIGMTNIYILDNNSSYQDLINYYKKIKYPVFRLDQNIGFLALWKTVVFQLFKNEYYIYTDSDILPVEDCPKDVIEYFYGLLNKYTFIDKVGFALKIDDFHPEHSLSDLVIKWEKKYWNTEIEENVFVAPIDTTFALYKPGAKGGSELSALRTGGEYVARHLTWYIDIGNLSDEDRNYIKTANKSSSWVSILLANNKVD